MNANVIVWDLETVPDLRGFAAANGLAGKTDEEVRGRQALTKSDLPRRIGSRIGNEVALILMR
jgi:hypothetical protein